MKNLNERIEEFIPLIIIVSILLIDILFVAGLINVFFKGNTTIIASVIAFIGAIIGGYITYYGVNRTLEHRDREVFLSEATEKLMLLEAFIDKYKKFFNTASLNRANIDDKFTLWKLPTYSELFVEELIKDKEKMYKSMEYESIKIIEIHQKSIEASIKKKPYAEEEAFNCIEKIIDIFQVFLESKKQLETKYFQYKRKK